MKRRLQAAGYVCFSIDNPPMGFDECADMKRLSPALRFRTIFDVGANTGEKASHYARHFPDAQIYCFEPVKETFATLQRSLSAFANVKCENLALGHKQERVRISLSRDSRLNSLVPDVNSAPELTGDHAWVEVMTLDHFASQSGADRIDFVKVDTEGFDLDVLKGGEELFRKNRIGFVMCETSIGRSAKRFVSFFELSEFLFARGFGFVGLYDSKHDERGLRYCNALYKLADAPGESGREYR